LATSELPQPLPSGSVIWRRRNPWEDQQKTRSTKTPSRHFWEKAYRTWLS
jgi:hypothetical protein